MLPNRRLVVLVALLSPLALLGSARAVQQVPDPAEPVTVFLVRHAEKVTTPPSKDPVLTAAGHERAHDLAKLLEHAGVTHLYSSEYQRTALTLAPLAAATGVQVETVSARDPEAQVKILQELPRGAVAVVAGHSNTIPALARALGGPATTIDESEYGRLFLVHVPKTTSAKSKALELRYGD